MPGRSDRWDDAGRYLAEVARCLKGAGADGVLMCAVTMHLVAPAVEAAIKVPFLQIVDVTVERLKAAGCRKPLLLATRYTMENGFYPARMERHGIEVVVPDADGRTLPRDIIFNELCAGKVLDRSRDALLGLIERARTAGADSVIFRCTEIGMIVDAHDLPVPGFDSTDIHAAARLHPTRSRRAAHCLSLPQATDRYVFFPPPLLHVGVVGDVGITSKTYRMRSRVNRKDCSVGWSTPPTSTGDSVFSGTSTRNSCRPTRRGSASIKTTPSSTGLSQRNLLAG